MSKRRKWFNRNRKKIVEQHGLVCDNCKYEGVLDDYEAHHIVPIVHGGTNYLSNLAILCSDCHGKAHGERGWADRRSMQRKGIDRAKAEGKSFGRPVKADKAAVARWRWDNQASISQTATHFSVSPSLVKQACAAHPK